MRHGFNQPYTNSQFCWTLSALDFPEFHSDYYLFLPDENTTETEDWPMTTPAPSRRASEFVGETYSGELNNHQPLEPCTYPNFDSAFPGSSQNPNGDSNPQTNQNRPFARLPINHLLDCAAPGPSTDPDHTPQPPNFSRISSYSSLTSTSSTTTLKPSSTFEQIYFLISTLYSTCLDASNLYIKHRSSSHRHPKTRTGRYHPYRSPPPPQKHTSASLMDNISTICTHLWRKARKDVMAPHRAEAETVRVMVELYEWGEVVARGWDRDTAGNDDGQASSSGEMGLRVADAARLFCGWLGDRRAVKDCEEMGNELKGLMEENQDSGGKDGESLEGLEDVIQ